MPFSKRSRGRGVGMFWQHGQSCNAPTRMLLRRSKLSQAKATIQQAAEATKVGDRSAVPRLIKQGIEEGANLINGGLGRPGGLRQRLFCKAR